jgi:hypothetical protein
MARRPSLKQKNQMSYLKISKREAREKIQKQIEIGRKILSINKTDENELNNIISECKEWSNANKKLLEDLFTGNSITNEYNRSFIAIYGIKQKRFNNDCQKRIEELELIIKKLDTISELPRIKLLSLKYESTIKKCISIVYLMLIIILLCGILMFFGILDRTQEIEMTRTEVISTNEIPSYFIFMKFISKGAFTEGYPIQLFIEVKKETGEEFSDGLNQFWVTGSCQAFSYPLKKAKSYNTYIGGMIELQIIDNRSILKGNDIIEFMQSGECSQFKLLYQTESGKHAYLLNSPINIEPSKVRLEIENNRRMMSIGIIAVVLAALGLVKGKNILNYLHNK